MMVAMSKPDFFAAEVGAERVLWASTWFVSIAAYAKTLPYVALQKL